MTINVLLTLPSVSFMDPQEQSDGIKLPISPENLKIFPLIQILHTADVYFISESPKPAIVC